MGRLVQLWAGVGHPASGSAERSPSFLRCISEGGRGSQGSNAKAARSRNGSKRRTSFRFSPLKKEAGSGSARTAAGSVLTFPVDLQVLLCHLLAGNEAVMLFCRDGDTVRASFQFKEGNKIILHELGSDRSTNQ